MPDSLTTLTKLHPGVHLITLSSPPDNRLTPEFLKSLSDNLDAVELEWRERGGGMSPPDPSKKDVKVEGGAVIITGIDRFFSNGLDYLKANQNKRFFQGMLFFSQSSEIGLMGRRLRSCTLQVDDLSSRHYRCGQRAW